uniref:SWIM-type domain-containing protein n=1 Tax=Caenorhabditis japonica TaxID=281687 RepID=A0A8R1HUL4_CAEJA
MESEVFEILQKTLISLLSDAAGQIDQPNEQLETLCHVAGMIKPEIVATTGKVRELVVKVAAPSVQRARRRKFENFTEKSIFDERDDIATWTRKIGRDKRKIGNLKQEEDDLEACFVEIEHPKKRECLQFLYPSVYFCTCKFFQITILSRQEDWLCVHLLAFFISKIFQKIDKVHCNPEISAIVRKILIRSAIL